MLGAARTGNKSFRGQERRIRGVSAYLDHAATTPLRESAREAWTEQTRRGGNPSSLHTSGRAARAVVEESREQIADALGARPSEVVFTSGGTEADNLAVKGTYAARLRSVGASRLVASGIEHHAVLDPVQHLVRRQGAEVTWLEPDRCGHVSVDDLRDALSSDGAADVALVSIMWANNEVGTVQPVADLAAVAREAGVPFHTDAVQAVGQARGGLRRERGRPPHRERAQGRWSSRCGGAPGPSRRQGSSRSSMGAARSGRCARAPWTRPAYGRSRSR